MPTFKNLIAIMFLVLGLSAQAQDYPAPSPQYTSPVPSSRFEVMQSPLAAKWTFRLDKYSFAPKTTKARGKKCLYTTR